MTEASSEADRLGVFLSYSREDLDFADQLVVTLEFAGFAPTIDRIGIHGAENWEEKLTTLIREADTVVFVLSPASAQSRACAWEVERAAAMGKRIVPVLSRPLGSVAPPAALAALNYIYFYADPANPGSGWAAGMRELNRTLRTDLAWLREHTRLLQRAVEWEAGDRMPGRLLSGEDIRAARSWEARRPREAPAPTALHRTFIAASEAFEAEQASAREQALAERERLVAEAEASRAAREHAQAAALSAAEREARAQRRTAQRTLAGLVVSSLLTAVAAGAGWWAWTKQQEAVAERVHAEEQTRQAEAQRKRAEAESDKAADAVTVVNILSRQVRDSDSKALSQEQRDSRLYAELERAALGGNVAAMRIAGLLALDGRGVPQDYAKAHDWWEKAAAGGSVGAMRNLGLLYANGQGVVLDYAKAREWYEKAAAAGDAGAMASLGALHADGQGVVQDFHKAREWYEKAAAAGEAGAMRKLGLLYVKGQGVALDYDKAREWYEKASAAGDAGAMRLLGLLYVKGQGVALDYGKARDWWEKAAAAGSLGAMTDLALLYENGHDVAQDYAKAREWYERAAAAGLAGAMTALGDYYESGLGVAQDYAKAREWYEKAASAGDAEARRLLERLSIIESTAAGRFPEALHLQEALAAEVESEDVKSSGKPGEETAGELVSVAWYALLAREPAKALAASERSLAIRPGDLDAETNRAHALMLLGRAAEAHDLYLAHKDQPMSPSSTKLWQHVIARDFSILREAGVSHPQMAGIEAELGIATP